MCMCCCLCALQLTYISVIHDHHPLSWHHQLLYIWTPPLYHFNTTAEEGLRGRNVLFIWLLLRLLLVNSTHPFSSSLCVCVCMCTYGERGRWIHVRRMVSVVVHVCLPVHVCVHVLCGCWVLMYVQASRPWAVLCPCKSTCTYMCTMLCYYGVWASVGVHILLWLCASVCATMFVVVYLPDVEVNGCGKPRM